MTRYGLVGGAVRHLGGWRPDKPDHRDFALPAPSQPLPPTLSLRASCPPIFDQGQIGSCTANATCAAMAYLEHQGASDQAFSRLFLYYYSRQLEGTPPDQDDGAENRDVMKALAQFGTCYESTWPYDNSSTRFSTPPSLDAKAEATQHKALFYYRCPDLATVKASIAQGFPAIVGFSVPANMQNALAYQTGEVHYPAADESFDGGHTFLCAAYDDARVIGGDVGAVGGPNSWGPDWGDAGWLWLPYRFFTSGLAQDFWTLRRAQV